MITLYHFEPSLSKGSLGAFTFASLASSHFTLRLYSEARVPKVVSTMSYSLSFGQSTEAVFAPCSKNVDNRWLRFSFVSISCCHCLIRATGPIINVVFLLGSLDGLDT